MSYNSNCNCQNMPCTCYGGYYQSVYGTNMWNINSQNANLPNTNCGHQQECSGCIDIYKGECVLYTDPQDLTNIGVPKNTTLNQALKNINSIQSLQDSVSANIIAALNDINQRIIAITGIPHANYG